MKISFNEIDNSVLTQWSPNYISLVLPSLVPQTICLYLPGPTSRLPSPLWSHLPCPTDYLSSTPWPHKPFSTPLVPPPPPHTHTHTAAPHPTGFTNCLSSPPRSHTLSVLLFLVPQTICPVCLFCPITCIPLIPLWPLHPSLSPSPAALSHPLPH